VRRVGRDGRSAGVRIGRRIVSLILAMMATPGLR